MTRHEKLEELKKQGLFDDKTYDSAKDLLDKVELETEETLDRIEAKVNSIKQILLLG